MGSAVAIFLRKPDLVAAQIFLVEQISVVRHEDKLRVLRIRLRRIEQANDLAADERMQARVEFVDNQRRACAHVYQYSSSQCKNLFRAFGFLRV